jgi:hypothetical protein
MKLERDLVAKWEKREYVRRDWDARERKWARKYTNFKAKAKRKVDRCSIRLFSAQW